MQRFCKSAPSNALLKLLSDERAHLPLPLASLFHIPASGLLNTASNRAAQGQDEGSPCSSLSRSGWAWWKEGCLLTPPSSPAPALQGRTPPSWPWCWEALQGGNVWMHGAQGSEMPPRTPVCMLMSKGDRRQMRLLQGEGQRWREGKVACALC